MEDILEIGNFGLRWYSFLIAGGLLAGAWIASIEAKGWGEWADHVYNIVILALPLSLIGARAYHVVDKWGEIYSNDPARVFLINEGGIAIYGAVAGSILAVFIYTKWKKLKFSRWLDIGAPGLILGQAIGRWGNFFNQETYGMPSDLPWAITIDPLKRILGYEGFEKFHPLFLYESLLNLIAFGLMMYARRRFQARLYPGDIALLYGVFYGAVRLSLENLRIGNWTIGGGLPTATLISALVLAICGGALIYRHWLRPRLDARKGLGTDSPEGDAPEAGPQETAPAPTE